MTDCQASVPAGARHCGLLFSDSICWAPGMEERHLGTPGWATESRWEYLPSLSRESGLPRGKNEYGQMELTQKLWTKAGSKRALWIQLLSSQLDHCEHKRRSVHLQIHNADCGLCRSCSSLGRQKHSLYWNGHSVYKPGKANIPKLENRNT